ncbi:MAG: glycerol-3-phosphate dehydrogenase [NAD(P)+] [Lysobacterales bacterium]|jgi:glycerol-3-phosphate dehydrogenase (NAD(P)+)|nr:MAG: glycerol-3-phosphate dehydrogenase [NAD(P)+] [Xanthomonadales bacterium]
MPAQRRPRIAVLGAGSWGTALAVLLARREADVVLWGRDAALIAEIERVRENPRYLPGVALPPVIAVGSAIANAVREADLVVVVVPSHAFRAVLKELAEHLPASCGVAWATKGFDPESGRLLHEVAREILPGGTPIAAITGPSFAREVAEGKPGAVTVHSPDPAFAERVAALLHTGWFRAYTGSDLIGAGLGGAMKNVLAVATGVCDGMGLGANARAGLITRGMAEMLKLNAALGGRPETLMGLAGLGDLVLTCTGDLSRNRRLGILLGQGVPLAEALARIGQVVEGVQTARIIVRHVERAGLDLPITEHVHRVLQGELTAEEGMRRLLAREMRAEFD